MTNRPRDRGTSFETAVVKFLREHGFPGACRMPFSSPLGDIDGVPVTLEAKNQKSTSMPEWLAQVTRAAARRGKEYPPVVVHKRVGKGTPDAYVTMTLTTFADFFLPAYQQIVDGNRANGEGGVDGGATSLSPAEGGQ